ncbi:MAG: NHLP bacteriocin export ABC transporter permease/ATPase subunit [Candidatus Promineifilaceae bacterium]
MSEKQTTSSVAEMLLLHLRYKEVAGLVNQGGTEWLLDDPSRAFILYDGSADLFAVPLQAGRIVGARTHLMHLEAGDIALGCGTLGETLGYLLVSGHRTKVMQIGRNRLDKIANNEGFQTEIATMLNRWIVNLTHAVVTDLPPKESIKLAANHALPLKKGTSASVQRGVLWIKHEQGKSQFGNLEHMPHLNGVGRWPLGERHWIRALENGQLSSIDTNKWLEKGADWADVDQFHQFISGVLEKWLLDSAETQARQLAAQVTASQQAINQGLRQLAQPLLPSQETPQRQYTKREALQATYQLVADTIDADIVMPASKSWWSSTAKIAAASQLQARRVALKGEWWREDHGALIGIVGESEDEVALLPTRRGYKQINLFTGSEQVVDEAVATAMWPVADMLYRGLADRPLTAWDLLRFGMKSTKRDVVKIFALGIAIGLSGLALPLATAFMVDTIIPIGQPQLLVSMMLLLLLVIGASASFQFVQDLFVLRLQMRLSRDLQTAIWMRVLNLPVSFFKRYTAGELGKRVLGVQMIQQVVSGILPMMLIAVFFALFNFGLLLYFDIRLAAVAMLLVLFSSSVSFTIGLRQLSARRQVAHSEGELSGQVLQSLEGIAKLRVFSAEGRAFANWAQQFGALKQLELSIESKNNQLSVFNAAFGIVTNVALFAMVVGLGQGNMTVGQFLAFNAAFIQFLFGMLTLSDGAIEILDSIPLYERLRPIIEQQPELTQDNLSPGKLAGMISLQDVQFKYHDDGPLILQQLSLTVQPGEFVAVVGPSGSGKSTLLRLLLGFEAPSVGAIYFDGNDAAMLNWREVRAQIGTVLQDGQILPESIFQNIVGVASSLTHDDAWAALKMAGLERDVRAMPMDLSTVLTQGGGTLSGGQRQRLLIARALVRRPRIILLDEATSALDNKTQAEVMKSVEALQSTRIVIAHRLSTIRNADRIIVMDHGKVVQEGTYQQLLREDGLFAELAKRQLA